MQYYKKFIQGWSYKYLKTVIIKPLFIRMKLFIHIYFKIINLRLKDKKLTIDNYCCQRIFTDNFSDRIYMIYRFYNSAGELEVTC